jgi:hypothetical protein
MSSEKVWEKVKHRLLQLQQDKALTSSKSFLIKLQQWADAKCYPLEIFNLFIEIFQHMSADIQKGHSINTLLEKTISGGYVQPEWDVNSVFQANGHIIQVIFNQFREEIGVDESKQNILIPIVLVVMNAKEVKELNSELICKNDSNKNYIHCESLKNLLVENWRQRYKDSPKLWQPFSSANNAMTIEKLVKKALNKVDCCKEPLEPDFVDIRQINHSDQRSQLNWLRQNGCIVIVDVISMAHPYLQQAFLQSKLDCFPNVIASIYPIHKELEAIQQTITVVEQYINLEFHNRFNEDFDSRCARISSHIDMNRWIKEQMPKILPDDLKAQEKDKQGISPLWYQFSKGANQ